MSSRVRAPLVCAALLLCVHPAHAGPLQLDLSTALARARERAPEAIAALARIAEARGRRAGAGVLPNPEITIGAGRRSGSDSLAIESEVAQSLALGRRGARTRVADAAIEQARATSDGELRALSYEVASVFYEARFAERGVELAQRDAELARRAVDAAERRRKAGDITDLGVDLAKIASGRARAALAAAQATRADALGRLGALVGAGPDDAIALAGELRPAPLTLDTLRGAVATRADVRALEAEVRVAQAEAALARATAWPELGLWFGYQRDEGDTILLGGLAFTLPIFDRAQGDRAAAAAKQTSAARAKTALVGAATRQIADAFEAYTRAREAVAIFDRDVAPVLADSEKLLERSIETGQIAINDYLVARQEILAGRREHLERELALANAALAARLVAGVAP